MMTTKDNICSRILTPKQVGPICWFMATFVAMFYSQRSRRILLDASEGWDKKSKLFTLLKDVLENKYLKVESRESKDYKNFSDNTFINILSYLNIKNKDKFPYNPKNNKDGFNPDLYIGKLYNLLNIDYKMFEYTGKDDTLVYTFLNEEYDYIKYLIEGKKVKISLNLSYAKKEYVEDNNAPQVLLVIATDEEHVGNKGFYNKYFPTNIIPEGDTKKNLKSFQEKIFYNGKEYNLDSVVLANWDSPSRHAIAGITCKKGRYVYNGWTRTSMDPAMLNKQVDRNIPCELMKFKWNIIKHTDFCLNVVKCIPDKLKKKKRIRELCFNFSKGKRILIYVRKDANRDTSTDDGQDDAAKPVIKSINKLHKSPKSPKKCPDGKVLNPKTGRCILIKNATKKSPTLPKSPKKCPDGKVLNPKTGRCILIKNATKKSPTLPKSPKKCPDGKVLNPKTGRCILIKNATKKSPTLHKSPKKCPDGKVLNPKTGRCILIRNKK